MLTQRLGSSTQKDDAFIDSLLTAIEEHPGSCDEVWLASDYGFPPLEMCIRDRPTLWTPFRLRCWIVWKSSACPAIPARTNSRLPKSTCFLSR